MESGCAEELHSNSTRWKQDPKTGLFSANPDLENVLCPNNCSGNGVCRDGRSEFIALMPEENYIKLEEALGGYNVISGTRNVTSNVKNRVL